MIKPGVDLRGLQPQMAIAYTIAVSIYAKHAQAGHCVITSASDGTHGPNSLHYSGRALDLRTRSLIHVAVPLIHRDLKLALGDQFDVVLEEDHFHIEWDVKDTPKASEA